MLITSKSEIIVNCSNLDESIKSVSRVYGLDNKVITDEIRKLDIDILAANAEDENYLDTYFIKKFNITPHKINKIFWFHFTRTIDINRFLEIGILPLDKSLEILMEDSYELAKMMKIKKFDGDLNLWRSIWDNAINHLPNNDKIKFDEKDFGPYGMLVRDIGLFPFESGSGNFYEYPEILQGIFGTISNLYHIDIKKEFMRKALPYVITFASDCYTVKTKYIMSSILNYIYSKLVGTSLSGHYNFNGKNKIVSKESIIRIDKIFLDKNGIPFLDAVYNKY